MSFDKRDDQTNDSNQNEDDFGLPDLDYKPLDEPNPSEEEQTTRWNADTSDDASQQDKSDPPAPQYREFQNMEDPKSNATILVVLVIAVVLLAGGFLVWKFVIQPNRAKQEQLAKDKALKAREEEARLAKQREEEERLRLEAEAAKAKPASGTVEVLTEPTKRYYVVIASAVDADLIMDYAKKLGEKGVGAKIIPPFRDSQFTRLAIADLDTFQAAQDQANSLKSEYGDALWVIKY